MIGDKGEKEDMNNLVERIKERNLPVLFTNIKNKDKRRKR